MLRKNTATIAFVIFMAVAMANAAVTTTWTDGGGDAKWSTLDNWDPSIPTFFSDAKHTSSLSDIQMNVATGSCLSFEGDGGSPTDRFMRIDAGNTLDVGGILKGSASTQFKLLLQDGSSGDLLLQIRNFSAYAGKTPIADPESFDAACGNYFAVM